MAFPLETIVSRAKRKGFVYPGSEIYGGLANAWDYGAYGSQLKKNIADARWKFFITERDDMIGFDTAILAHPQTWVASGHVGTFGDFLIDDKKTGQRFRPDKLIEDDFHNRSITLEAIKDKYHVENLIPESRGAEKMYEYIMGEKLRNPDTKKDAERTNIRKFSMMLSTHLGVIEDESSKVWLRPETCQSLFTNFRNVCDTTRMRVPFGMAQIGKSFRNEITPGQFLYRTREFEQMEIEYFVENSAEKAKEAFEMWKTLSMRFWREIVKLQEENLRFREHEKDELSHYSAGTFDVEYNYPWGWGELQGIANRTDFDLTQHQKVSGKDLSYKDPYTGQRYLPWVIEPSFGLSRTVMAVMLDCYDEEQLENGETRVVVRFPFNIAPITCAIFPLMEKDEDMSAIAKDLATALKKQGISTDYDGSGNIGKRYRRQDEIGTPFCITIDHQTKEDKTVTVRHRDSMAQDRMAIADIPAFLLSQRAI